MAYDFEIDSVDTLRRAINVASEYARNCFAQRLYFNEMPKYDDLRGTLEEIYKQELGAKPIENKDLSDLFKEINVGCLEKGETEKVAELAFEFIGETEEAYDLRDEYLSEIDKVINTVKGFTGVNLLDLLADSAGVMKHESTSTYCYVLYSENEARVYIHQGRNWANSRGSVPYYRELDFIRQLTGARDARVLFEGEFYEGEIAEAIGDDNFKLQPSEDYSGCTYALQSEYSPRTVLENILRKAVYNERLTDFEKTKGLEAIIDADKPYVIPNNTKDAYKQFARIMGSTIDWTYLARSIATDEHTTKLCSLLFDEIVINDIETCSSINLDEADLNVITNTIKVFSNYKATSLNVTLAMNLEENAVAPGEHSIDVYAYRPEPFSNDLANGVAIAPVNPNFGDGYNATWQAVTTTHLIETLSVANKCLAMGVIAALSPTMYTVLGNKGLTYLCGLDKPIEISERDIDEGTIYRAKKIGFPVRGNPNVGSNKIFDQLEKKAGSLTHNTPIEDPSQKPGRIKP